MTDEHNTRDLWGERGEGERWEHRYDAGQVLDWWR